MTEIDPDEEELFRKLKLLKDDIRSVLSRITTPEKVDLAMLYLNGGLTDENIFTDDGEQLTDQRLVLAGLTIREYIFGVRYDIKDAIEPFENGNNLYFWRVLNDLEEICNLLGTRESAQLADTVVLEFNLRKLELNYDGIDDKDYALAYEIGLYLKSVFNEIIIEFRNRLAIAEAEAKKGDKQ